jgi:FkbH-like protein
VGAEQSQLSGVWRDHHADRRGVAVTFLEAQQILAKFTGGEELRFTLAMSGTGAQLDLYLRAAAAKTSRAAVVEQLPFNTLAQRLLQPAAGGLEVYLLLPWDFVPELDWRSGLPSLSPDADGLRQGAQNIAQLLRNRPNARYLYLSAPIPPVMTTLGQTEMLRQSTANCARSLGAELLPESAFSMETYLMSGCPVGGKSVGDVAERVIAQAVSPPARPADMIAAGSAEETIQHEACKVLVTDLDNVMWSGGIAEEGIGGIKCQPEGTGYKHFLYQTLLKKLKHQGILLAVVSRNDRDAVLPAFSGGAMTVGEDDFVAIVATYHAKSAQIRELAAQLNLGLSSFVFVDDNQVELEEVRRQLPEVNCVRFPERETDLPAFFEQIVRLFPKASLTAEDRDRTEMYRRRLSTLVPSDVEGADLTSYLRGLQMELQIHDRSRGERSRAVQLIHKTNQFNLNGKRLGDDEVAAILAAGGRLYTATLKDRSGSHGEILACLLAADGTVRSLVMSCRVFQRRVEFAFIAWLAAREPLSRFDFKATERNEPLRQFLKNPAFGNPQDGIVNFDASRFAREHAADLELMSVTAPPAPASAMA